MRRNFCDCCHSKKTHRIYLREMVERPLPPPNPKDDPGKLAFEEKLIKMYNPNRTSRRQQFVPVGIWCSNCGYVSMIRMGLIESALLELINDPKISTKVKSEKEKIVIQRFPHLGIRRNSC